MYFSVATKISMFALMASYCIIFFEKVAGVFKYPAHLLHNVDPEFDQKWWCLFRVSRSVGDFFLKIVESVAKKKV